MTVPARRALAIVALTALVLAGIAVAVYLRTERSIGRHEVYDPSVSTVALGVPEVLFERSIYGWGPAATEQLERPIAVAITSDGGIVTAKDGVDGGPATVIAFSRTGELDRTFGDDASLLSPRSIAVDQDGRVWVADRAGAIHIFDSEGVVSKTIPFDEAPLAMEIIGDRVWTTRVGSVVVGDLNGTRMAQFGSRGDGEGEFDSPGGIAVDAVGNMYVADSMNYRVVCLDSQGRQVWSERLPAPMSVGSSAPDAAAMPTGIALHKDGYLFVTFAGPRDDSSGMAGGVLAMSAEGEVLGVVVEAGHEDGRLSYPTGIEVFGDTLVVADTYNNRLQIFEVRPTAGREISSAMTQDAEEAPTDESQGVPAGNSRDELIGSWHLVRDTNADTDMRDAKTYVEFRSDGTFRRTGDPINGARGYDGPDVFGNLANNRYSIEGSEIVVQGVHEEIRLEFDIIGDELRIREWVWIRQ